MNLALTEEEAAFRDEMRAFFTTKVPAEIREKSATGQELSKDEVVTTMRILNENGLAVPHWPAEFGGRDWTAVQRHIWLDEMQLASVPEPLAFNASMVGPVIATFGSQELDGEPRHLVVPGLLRARGRIGPCVAAHHRYSRR